MLTRTSADEMGVDDMDWDELAARMRDAVEDLDIAEVQALLASGVDPDAWGITRDDDRPLQAVARLKGVDAVSIAKALIEAGADIDYQGDYDCTALARSILLKGPDGDDWAMARYLISAGANPSLYNRDGLCPMDLACCYGNGGAVLAMLEAGMDANVRCISGPLLWHCAYREPDLVRHLLARGADPNGAATGRNCSGQTPLQRAVESYSDGCVDEDTFLDIAVQLIQAGADPAQIEPAPACLASLLLALEERAALSDVSCGIAEQKSRGRL